MPKSLSMKGLVFFPRWAALGTLIFAAALVSVSVKAGDAIVFSNDKPKVDPAREKKDAREDSRVFKGNNNSPIPVDVFIPHQDSPGPRRMTKEERMKQAKQ